MQRTAVFPSAAYHDRVHHRRQMVEMACCSLFAYAPVSKPSRIGESMTGSDVGLAATV